MLNLTPNQVGLLQCFLNQNDWEFNTSENGVLNFILCERDFPLGNDICVSLSWGEEFLQIDSWRFIDEKFHNFLYSSFDPNGFLGIISWIENTIASQAEAILERNEGLIESRL